MRKKVISLALSGAIALSPAAVPGASGMTTYAASASAARITLQPVTAAAENNAWITFTVQADGEGLTYQWQLSDDQGKNWRNSSIQTAAYSTTLTAANNGHHLRRCQHEDSVFRHHHHSKGYCCYHNC